MQNAGEIFNAIKNMIKPEYLENCVFWLKKNASNYDSIVVSSKKTVYRNTDTGELLFARHGVHHVRRIRQQKPSADPRVRKGRRKNGHPPEGRLHLADRYILSTGSMSATRRSTAFLRVVSCLRTSFPGNRNAASGSPVFLRPTVDFYRSISAFIKFCLNRKVLFLFEYHGLRHAD